MRDKQNRLEQNRTKTNRYQFEIKHFSFNVTTIVIRRAYLHWPLHFSLAEEEKVCSSKPNETWVKHSQKMCISRVKIAPLTLR